MASHNLKISNIPFVVDERSIIKVYSDAVDTMRIDSPELQPLYLQTLLKVATGNFRNSLVVAIEHNKS